MIKQKHIFWVVCLCVDCFLCLLFCGWRYIGFEYSEKTILGVNAASKWAQEMAELNLAIKATPFYLGYKDAGLIGVSCVAQDNHLDDYMWYTLHNIVSLVLGPAVSVFVLLSSDYHLFVCFCVLPLPLCLYPSCGCFCVSCVSFISCVFICLSLAVSFWSVCVSLVLSLSTPFFMCLYLSLRLCLCMSLSLWYLLSLVSVLFVSLCLYRTECSTVKATVVVWCQVKEISGKFAVLSRGEIFTTA